MPDVPWSVVVPYYNEKDYLPAMLGALTAQTCRPFQLILVDNASTDGSAEIARAALANCQHITPVYLHEPRPGKINALECGLAHVDAVYVAFCDADTWYPPHYLARCAEIFANASSDVAAVMATGLKTPPCPSPTWKQRKTLWVSRLLRRQAHTGGFGQTFRTEMLRQAGGFSVARWPFVLEDHEVMQRVLKLGRAVHDIDLWCVPSQRRGDRSAVDWTLAERLLYHVVPFGLKDWFFYNFLTARFTRRKMDQLKLREKNWT